jgi:Spy/CpxP family protein refolding chaperone
MSYGVQSAGLFGSSSQTGGTSNSLRPFANLDLTEDQRTQIRSIFKTAKTDGSTQAQIQQQIFAILTPTQQTTLQNDIAAQTTSSQSADPAPPPPPPGLQGSSSGSDPLSNLGLTSDQKSQIDTILENAQTNGTSQSDVLAQIDAVLTPTQQSAFLQDVQTAQAIVSGQSQSGSGGTSASSTSTFAGTLTESDVQNQVAAATSLILKQFQTEVGTTT